MTRWFEADQALALARAGRHQEAHTLLAPRLPHGPATDSSGSKALYTMGVVKRLAGDLDAGLWFQRLALASAADGRGAELRRMRVLTEIGLALLDLQRPHEAVMPLEAALALSRQEQTHTSPDRTDILVGLARARLAAGRHAEARQLLLEADAFWRTFDPDNRDAKEAARWLGATSTHPPSSVR